MSINSKESRMPPGTALVVTSIAAPNSSLIALAAGAHASGLHFIVIGDTKSPREFQLDGCDYYDLARQKETHLKFAKLCPTRSYARKNIGYLLAIHAAAPLIVETDDDNTPRAEFWSERTLNIQARFLRDAGWVNVYRYFTDSLMWPRGLPLDAVNDELPPFEALPSSGTHCCPIQQGLADGNPDVDAIYRLLLPLPLDFRLDRRVVLGTGAWCPFNSQNTTWWPEAYPLLYLPAYCSFRMTDIWRSFVAQKIAWTYGWNVLFHEPTVRQERNNHDLAIDFADEVPGYLNNRAIAAALDQLALDPSTEAIGRNLKRCYETLVGRGWVGAQELALVDAWLEDLSEQPNRSASIHCNVLAAA